MLTHRQKQMLDFIKLHLEVHGYSPSFEEMMAALQLKSRSNVHRILDALEERGFIHRLKHRARAIQVIDRQPLATQLSHCTDHELATEAAKRGYVMGHWMRHPSGGIFLHEIAVAQQTR